MTATIEALERATQGLSMANYPAIYEGLLEKGIPEAEIKPRVNVLTYKAWLAVGRQVRRGEHGVKVVTWIAMTKKDKKTGETLETFKRPRRATVFHISQTDPI